MAVLSCNNEPLKQDLNPAKPSVHSMTSGVEGQYKGHTTGQACHYFTYIIICVFNRNRKTLLAHTVSQYVTSFNNRSLSNSQNLNFSTLQTGCWLFVTDL